MVNAIMAISATITTQRLYWSQFLVIFTTRSPISKPFVVDSWNSILCNFLMSNSTEFRISFQVVKMLQCSYMYMWTINWKCLFIDTNDESLTQCAHPKWHWMHQIHSNMQRLCFQYPSKKLLVTKCTIQEGPAEIHGALRDLTWKVIAKYRV